MNPATRPVAARVGRAYASLSLLLLAACRGSAPPGGGDEPRPSDAAPSAASAPPPWVAADRPPVPPDGMVWIPPGALVAGTLPDQLPRVADAEMPGEQIVLGGFFMSVFPYPNEEGAIPLSNVTAAEAARLCAERGARLCTELEWERACKGPDNRTYEYGERYRAEICGTGAASRPMPSGLRVACRSDFGVRDLHGGLWEWTASPWGRGSPGGDVAIRGGDSLDGEVTARCANGEPRAATARAADLGFRCCAGPPNEAEVVLRVERGRPLEERSVDPALAAAILERLPDEARLALPPRQQLRASRAWIWRPTGNERLHVVGGCTGEHQGRGCAVIVARGGPEPPRVLAWAASGVYAPTLRVDPAPSRLWVYGGDARSHFRTALGYSAGRVQRGETQRNVKAAP